MATITLTYQFADEAELQAHFARNESGPPPSRVVIAPTPVQPVKQEAAPAKKPDAQASTASAPSGATPPAASPAPAPAAQATETTADAPATGRTIEEAKALTIKLVQAKGRDTAKALLDEFKVPVAAKLAPEQVDEFVAKAEKLLGA